MRTRFNLLLSVSALAMVAATPVFAEEAAQDRSNVFDLGEIVVIGSRIGTPALGVATVTQQQMWTFEKLSLDQAVNLAPGVNSELDSNGRRNESDIFVRGFGRWQVPLMVDGVRIYLPADNRIDFARFLTGDVAEIQIQKGYASVIDGPGAMGGIINLVSRKPSKPFEAEVRAGLNFGDGTQYEGWNGYAMLGTRQEKYYLQGSLNYSDRDYWNLSESYKPTAISMQQGNRRINSDSNDWRANVKAGFTPNDTDEYTINYTNQQGSKGGLLNVYNNPQSPPNSFWRWPQWDVESVTALTNTQIGAASYVKTKFYYNVMKNTLKAYDDITYTMQSANGRFTSPYSDDSYGTSIEAGTDLIPAQSVKLAFHYRVDSHDEYNDNRPTSATARMIEPVQHQGQDTWSAAVQDTYHLMPNVDLVGGLSYDKYWVTASQDYNTTLGLYSYPRGGADAVNWQGAAIWHYSNTGELHASVSDRARFPIFFELYSTRFGTAIPNPSLGPERATNYEIGIKEQVLPNLHVEGATFYSHIDHLIQTVQVAGGASPQTQTQNVGTGKYYGFEVAADTQVTTQIKLGGNYTYTHRVIHDSLQPFLQATGVPLHKALLYAGWSPLAPLTVTPSLEIASNRWSDYTTTPAQLNPYIRVGAYQVVNLQVEYAFTRNVDVAIGAKNLLDQNYELSWGLPQQGRNFFAKLRATF